MTDLQLCEAALAKLHEAEEILEQVERNPRGGWCAAGALDLTEQAIEMLTPFDDDDDDDGRPRLIVDNTRGGIGR